MVVSSASSYQTNDHEVVNINNNMEHAIGEVEVCFINLLTKKPQKFPDDLLLIFN